MTARLGVDGAARQAEGLGGIVALRLEGGRLAQLRLQLAVFPAFRSLINDVAMAESRSMVLSHELAAALSEPGAVIPLTCESVLSTIENSFSSPETLFEAGNLPEWVEGRERPSRAPGRPPIGECGRARISRRAVAGVCCTLAAVDETPAARISSSWWPTRRLTGTRCLS